MRVPGNDTKCIAAARQSSVISRYAYITTNWIDNRRCCQWCVEGDDYRKCEGWSIYSLIPHMDEVISRFSHIFWSHLIYNHADWRFSSSNSAVVLAAKFASFPQKRRSVETKILDGCTFSMEMAEKE